jgi:hypothetical protein
MKKMAKDRKPFEVPKPKRALTDGERITGIIQHIKRVESNCNIIARKLHDVNPVFALKLIQLGRIHDASKFDEFEFTNLHAGSALFEEALTVHQRKNPHHPEYWKGGIHEMPKIYLAEMVCDCKARGEEFGTSVRLWFHDEATKKYEFKMTDDCGQHIEHFLNLLMNQPFDQGLIKRDFK